MKILPSFVGVYDSDKEVLKALSLYHPSPNILNVSNKQNSTSCPNQEINKGQSKPSLIFTNARPLDDPQLSKANNGVTCDPISINKVGKYFEGGEGNTTFSIECKGVKTISILDSGVGMVIMTKKIWEA